MMWKKRKDEFPDESTPEPVRTPGRGYPAAQPAAPPPVAPRIAKAEAMIGKSVVIKGQIYSQEDLYLDGQVEGTLDAPANKLTIGKSGRVQANIKAREVDVYGTVHGNIESGEKITIRSAANLVGDLRSATISIEDGAYFKGSIDIVRTASVKPAAPPVSPPQVKPAAGPLPGPAAGGEGKTRK